MKTTDVMTTRLNTEYRKSIVLTGDHAHRDFSQVLEPYLEGWEVVDVDALLGDANWQHRSLDLIVIAEASNGQVLASRAASLRQRFPLVPLVGLLGSWCEGEDRWGLPPGNVPRVYWHKWPAEFERFLRQLRASGVTQWHLPTTVARGERLTRNQETGNQGTGEFPRGLRISRTVALSASHREAFELVEDVCLDIGWTTARWQGPSPQADMASLACPPVVAVVNCDSHCFDPHTEFLKWAHDHGVPVLVIAGFARFSDVKRWRSETGAMAVVSKPFENHELQRVLMQAAERQSEGLLQMGGKAIA